MKRIWLLLLALAAGLAGCSKDDQDTEPTFTEKFDLLFALELQKRGYIADAMNITPEEVKRITELDVSGDKSKENEIRYDGELTSLRGIEYFESLTVLKCYGNQLTSLDVSKNTALTELDCSYNQLTSLDISKNTTLTELDCNDNQLTSLDVSKNTALTELDCNWNQLTTLDVSKNSKLTELWCSRNLLTILDVSKNTALTQLWCDENPGDGTVFPVTAWFDNNTVPSYFTTGSWNYNGATITIDYTKDDQTVTPPTSDITTDFDPLFAHELQKRGYIADANKITFAEVNGITELDVSGKLNEESDIPTIEKGELTSLKGIQYFKSLTKLICNYNQMTTLDVSKNTALTQLRCSGNNLKTLDVSRNTALTELECGDNRLTALDVSNNTALTTLHCNDNPGDKRVFSVTAWFDNHAIPSGFTTGSWEWEYDLTTITIDYRKAE